MLVNKVNIHDERTVHLTDTVHVVQGCNPSQQPSICAIRIALSTRQWWGAISWGMCTHLCESSGNNIIQTCSVWLERGSGPSCWFYLLRWYPSIEETHISLCIDASKTFRCMRCFWPHACWKHVLNMFEALVFTTCLQYYWRITCLQYYVVLFK